MTPHDGPYYTGTSHAIQVLGVDVPTGSESIYPDLGHSLGQDGSIYSTANESIQDAQAENSTQFAGLIQAAKAAAGESDGTLSASGASTQRRRAMRASRTDFGTELDSISQRKGKSLVHSRAEPIETTTSSAQEDQPRIKVSIEAQATQKRKRASDLETFRTSYSIDQPVLHQEEGCLHTNRRDENRDLARHASAALFRRLSKSSKKYTRPPMSKLFTSLELSPESFLQLQAAAKAYMLSPLHPERKDCVGQRGKGDSELVKLRLWNCVKDFLEGDGNGHMYFGPQVLGDEGGTRTMFWPTDKNKIITVVTPFLRRMVTNERQRQYAVETRKLGSQDDVGDGKRRHSGRDSLPVAQGPGTIPETKHAQETAPQFDNIIRTMVNTNSNATRSPDTIIQQYSVETMETALAENPLLLHINIMKDGRRFMPRIDTSTDRCSTLQDLREKLYLHIDVIGHNPFEIQVLLPVGLLTVGTETNWNAAVNFARRTEWLDGTIKVVVDL
ncbi:hypothetical protein MMC09_001537 [Bachmanniomyces sp. S44760]|nr:hypothetical protein [Bachmanniomyces sp. S44760]